VTQGAGEMGFAGPARAGDQEILCLLDPLSLGESGDLSRLEVARMFIVDFLHRGIEAQAGLPAQTLLVEQQREPFGKG
jgi:hypothetical protein